MVDALYLNHFRLQRAPFSIAPDPRFLYLGSRHREALAHLLWATRADGGFVVITGEVGTGKTTLSRCLLEQLPDDTDLAFIINPRLSASELLATLCRELTGPNAPVPASDQARVDRINQLLLDAHARGRRTLLLIDEAQNLATDVLEQLRLLTNLETSERKLLQVILLGQPELDSKLRQPALRQLDQRVTARYHLQPLSRGELEACVRHRLEVAGSDRGLFTRGALRSLYRQSGGIPRLANLIADRALLGAYALDRRRVTAAMIRQATREVRGHGRATARLAIPAATALVAGVTIMLGAGWWFWTTEGDNPLPDSAPMGTAQSVAPVVVPVAVPPDTGRREVPTPAPEWARGNREAAMQAVLERWFVPAEYARAGAPCDALPELGLACHILEGSTDDLRRLNLPAVLQSRAGDGYLALLSLNGNQAQVSGPEGEREVPLEALQQVWSGRATLVWQLPPDYRGPLREGDQGAAVDALHQALQTTGYLNEAGNSRYDAATVAAVRRFQSQRGLAVDGIVGPRTWMLLSQAAEPGIPALTSAEAG